MERTKGDPSNSIIEHTYGKCHRSHPALNGKTDGCLEYSRDRFAPGSICEACGCHRNFHQRQAVDPPVVFETVVIYSKCQRIHDVTIKDSVDGCQEFTPGGKEGTAAALICAACDCHRAFHQKKVTKEIVREISI